MKLIDIDERIEALEYHIDIELPLEEEILVINFLNQAETIDAVPVVRCKECKHYKIMENCYRKDGTPIYFCASDMGCSGLITDDSFCSFGERKDG